MASALPSIGKRGPTSKVSDWETIDPQLRSMLSPISEQFNSNSLSTSEAAISFSTIVHEHLHTTGHISNCIYSRCSTGTCIKSHHESQLIRLSKKLSVAKNNARRYIHSATESFLNSVRTHNKITRLARQSAHTTSTRRQEKAFVSNPWKFAKSACSDDSANVLPAFSSSEAWNHFSDSFSSSRCSYQSLPSWIYDCMPSPSILMILQLHPRESKLF